MDEDEVIVSLNEAYRDRKVEGTKESEDGYGLGGQSDLDLLGDKTKTEKNIYGGNDDDTDDSSNVFNNLDN